MKESDWNYTKRPEPNGDARKIVTLMDHQRMVWVGIRAYHHQGDFWMNNNEPIAESVIAWMDLPEPATGRWVNGKLICVESERQP